jgi:hypothetical protein
VASKRANAGKIAVVTVHGTGDTAASVDGQKWFQRGSAFTGRLCGRLAAAGLDADIIPHLWSGANSARAREEGADKLADVVKRLHRAYDGVHIIGHSHGGNVANEAADFLRWGRRGAKRRIASLTTVGTPFFRNVTGAAEAAAGLIFLVLTLLSTAVVAIFGLAALIMVFTGEFTTAEALTMVTLLAPTVLAIIFMLRLSFNGARRILRPTSRGGGTSIHAIWHKNDEAIAFLQKVEALPIEPFPKGMLARGSRSAAIVWGVRVVLLIALVATYSLVAMPLGAPAPHFMVGTSEERSFGPIPDNIMYFVLGTPLVFSFVYLGYRLLFGVIPEFTLRGVLNKAVGGLLRGMAFGKDGDQRLSQIAPYSHTQETEEVVLDGPAADRMQVNAAGAAAQLIEKYRWALFTVGEDTNASISAMATDAMTWDSLIHTTYFDQPEVAEMIADYIAAKAKAEAAG